MMADRSPRRGHGNERAYYFGKNDDALCLAISDG
jgi:hypothetical protein